MCCGVARWSQGGARGLRCFAGGCPVVIEHEIEGFGSFRKSVFGPLGVKRGGFYGFLLPL